MDFMNMNTVTMLVLALLVIVVAVMLVSGMATRQTYIKKAHIDTSPIGVPVSVSFNAKAPVVVKDVFASPLGEIAILSTDAEVEANKSDVVFQFVPVTPVYADTLPQELCMVKIYNRTKHDLHFSGGYTDLNVSTVGINSVISPANSLDNNSSLSSTVVVAGESKVTYFARIKNETLISKHIIVMNHLYVTRHIH